MKCRKVSSGLIIFTYFTWLSTTYIRVDKCLAKTINKILGSKFQLDPQEGSKPLRDLRVVCNGGATTYKIHAAILRAAFPALQELGGDCLIVPEASPAIMSIIMEIAYFGRSEKKLI